MKEHPIFLRPMIIGQALEGRISKLIIPTNDQTTPPYRKNDRLWVKESFARYEGRIFYRPGFLGPAPQVPFELEWLQSTRMPRENARIIFEVTADPVVKLLFTITREEIRGQGIGLPPSPRFLQ